MARSGLNSHQGLTTAYGQEADIMVFATDPRSQGFANHCISVHQRFLYPPCLISCVQKRAFGTGLGGSGSRDLTPPYPQEIA